MAKKILNALFGRTILIVGSDPKTRDEIAGAFQNFRCHVLLAEKEADAINLIHTNPQVEIVVMDVENPINKSFPFLEKIRGLDEERPPVFFITNQRDAHFDEAFFLGAEAIFLKPVHFDELVKGVAFSHEILMDHSERRHVRRRIRRAKVQFSNDSTGMQSNGYVTNISVGGFFISSMYNLPAAHQTIQFRLLYEGEQQIELTGRATVKWLRPLSQYGRPPGFGAEFKDLDEAAKGHIAFLAEKG